MSLMLQPDLYFSAQACLGESPVWDDVTQTLYFIDITAGAIYAVRHHGKQVLIYQSSRRVGALALTTRGNLIFTEDAQVALLSLATRQVIRRSEAASALASFRYNDGACDPQGYFLTGLMDEQHSPGSGQIDRYDHLLQKSTLRDTLGLPNGIAWSASGQTVFYVDSVARTLYQAQWSAENNALQNARVFAVTPERLGRPDGIACDNDDNLWVCQFNGHCILQYSSEGTLLQKIDLSVPRPTSCCFGGADLTTLYITSATFGMSDSERIQYPLAGDIFQMQVPVRGLLPFRFNESERNLA